MVNGGREPREASTSLLDSRRMGLALALSIAALIVCAATTHVVWLGVRAERDRQAREQFELLARDAEGRIVERMRAYEEVLLATKGLFEGSTAVDRRDFHRFISSLELERRYPGIQAVGFAVAVPPASRVQHVAALRAEGFAEYTIRPGGERDLYTPIVFIEPFAGRNLRAFGFDMHSEAVRREAMDRARDNGQLALSGEVTLVQETDRDVQPGFLMYMAVYRDGAPVATRNDRRAALQGWVYAAFRAGDLMKGVYGEQTSDLDVELFDGPETAASTLLYDSDGVVLEDAGSPFTTQRALQVAGHRWTLVARGRAEFQARSGSDKPTIIAVVGGGASVLIACLVYLLASGRIALRSSRALNRKLVEAQRALAESEALVRGIFEAAPQPIFLKDRAGRYVLANPAALEGLSSTADGVVGQPTEAVHGAEAGALVAHDRTIIESGVAQTFEERVRRGDGERTYLVAKAPHRDASGKVIGVIGVAQDITERNRRELETRRMAAAVEHAPVSIVQSNAAGIVEYVNPAYETTSGIARADAIGRDLVSIIGLADDPRASDLRQTIDAGRVWAGTVVTRRGEGAAVTEDVIVAPVTDSAGAIHNHVAVKRDISKEVALAQQLAEAQRLEVVARLAGGVAHDFNNLLTVILSCAEALQESLEESAPCNAEDVSELRSAAERARDITRNLLAVGRRQMIQPVPLKLDAVVAASEKLLKRLVTEDIAVTTSAEPGLWTARCDASQFEQILLNLVVNAGDAMPNGGALRIETANASVGAEDAQRFPGIAPGRYVRLAVADSGVGMSAEVKERAFEPFFTTKPVGKGTGLGLATVHGIVKQNGGYIRVESEIGRGTRFEILLPAIDAEPALPAPENERSSRGDETVLVVEDEPAVREIARRTLRSAGYDVIVAASGPAALDLLVRDARRVQLLLTDVVMPDMNGREVAAAVRRLRPDVRVLFVSGHAEDVLAERGVLERGIDLIQKPFTPGVLLARVRRALDLGRA